MLAINFKSVFLPTAKIYSYLPNVKSPFGLRTPGVYSTHCECDQVYIGQSDRTVQIRIKECNRHIRLSQTDILAVEEYSTKQDHIIKLNGRMFLLQKLEPIKMEIRPHDINREDKLITKNLENPFATASRKETSS